ARYGCADLIEAGTVRPGPCVAMEDDLGMDQHVSVPVEGGERLPGLPGVRKVGPDTLTRRCSDQGCNFGTRAGLNRAAIPALRALATAVTGSPSQRSPDFATSARSRQHWRAPGGR